MAPKVQISGLENWSALHHVVNSSLSILCDEIEIAILISLPPVAFFSDGLLSENLHLVVKFIIKIKVSPIPEVYGFEIIGAIRNLNDDCSRVTIERVFFIYEMKSKVLLKDKLVTN